MCSPVLFPPCFLQVTTKVLLNVYDLSPANDYLVVVGMGLHHSGVEILGREYSYGSGGGVFDGPPRTAPGARFRCQLDLGTFEGGKDRLNRALDELRHGGGFGPDGYNLIRRNCNHFCNALVWQLARRTIPPHVNRLANIGECCSCLLPRQLLGDSPVGGGSENASGNRASSFAGGAAPPGASMNRTGGAAADGGGSVIAFAGKGQSLGGTAGGGGGGGTSSSSSETTGLLSRWSTTSRASSTVSTGSISQSVDDLTDRREKARIAALARLERSQQQSPQQQQQPSRKES